MNTPWGFRYHRRRTHMFEVYQEVGWLRAAGEDEKNINLLARYLPACAAHGRRRQYQPYPAFLGLLIPVSAVDVWAMTVNYQGARCAADGCPCTLYMRGTNLNSHLVGRLLIGSGP